METNHIYTGDNVEIMSTFPDNSIDLVLTSPPYDLVDFVDGVLKTFPGKGLRNYQGYTWDFVSVAEQLYRITKPGGVIVWVVGDKTDKGTESGSSFRQALYFMSLGLRLHDTMIYQTNKPPLTHNRYEPEFEYMFVFSKGTPKTFNPIKVKTIWGGSTQWHGHNLTNIRASAGQVSAIRHRQESTEVKCDKIKGNVWFFPSGFNKSTKDEIAFQHPAVFPEQLAKDHIVSWSNPGDIVLDPFVGSGSVPKMCVETGRKYIGIDCSPAYVEISKKRIECARIPLFTNW